MHQARLSIDSDVRFHAKVPPIAFLARMHLWIARFVLVLGGGGCRNQGGIDGGADFEQQALSAQQLVDHDQNLVGQLVMLQAVAKAQDAGLIGQAGKAFGLRKPAV